MATRFDDDPAMPVTRTLSRATRCSGVRWPVSFFFSGPFFEGVGSSSLTKGLKGSIFPFGSYR